MRACDSVRESVCVSVSAFAFVHLRARSCGNRARACVHTCACVRVCVPTYVRERRVRRVPWHALDEIILRICVINLYVN